jgi:hypothetical protein
MVEILKSDENSTIISENSLDDIILNRYQKLTPTEDSSDISNISGIVPLSGTNESEGMIVNVSDTTLSDDTLKEQHVSKKEETIKKDIVSEEPITEEEKKKRELGIKELKHKRGLTENQDENYMKENKDYMTTFQQRLERLQASDKLEVDRKKSRERMIRKAS